MSYINIEVDENETIETFGGECNCDPEISEYGLRIGEVNICGIQPKQMVKLAQKIVDHLIVNRHRFAIIKTNIQDQPERLGVLKLK